MSRIVLAHTSSSSPKLFPGWLAGSHRRGVAVPSMHPISCFGKEKKIIKKEKVTVWHVQPGYVSSSLQLVSYY